MCNSTSDLLDLITNFLCRKICLRQQLGIFIKHVRCRKKVLCKQTFGDCKANQTKVLEHKGNVTTRTKDKTKLVSYIECDTNKSPRQHLGDCCYLVPIYRFRKILAALGSGISQLTYRSFNGQAWGSRICSSIQPL